MHISIIILNYYTHLVRNGRCSLLQIPNHVCVYMLYIYLITALQNFVIYTYKYMLYFGNALNIILNTYIETEFSHLLIEIITCTRQSSFTAVFVSTERRCIIQVLFLRRLLLLLLQLHIFCV